MNTDILDELILKQKKSTPHTKKLHYTDIKRISEHINSSIFDNNDCCIWQGYITNENNKKASYVNFFYKNKKVILHRLLYENYVSRLSKSEKIKFVCKNNGKCCNVNHMKKMKSKSKSKSKSNGNIINKEKEELSLFLEFG